jgi:hypothetical protein
VAEVYCGVLKSCLEVEGSWGSAANALEYAVSLRRIVQCSVVQCRIVQCSVVQNSAVQCSAVQNSAVQCSAVQRSAE